MPRSRQEILAEIEEQRAILASSAPADEKELAQAEIFELEQQLQGMETPAEIAEPSTQEVSEHIPEEVVVATGPEVEVVKEEQIQAVVISEATKPGTKPGSKRAKVVIETGLEQKKQGKKEPKRKVVLDKPVAEIKKPKKKKVALDADYKNRKNVLPTFDALLVNSKIAKEVSRSFLRKGIKYGIAGHKGIYSIYMIPVSAQLSKAFSVYKEVAEKYDINVNKSTAYTTI